MTVLYYVTSGTLVYTLLAELLIGVGPFLPVAEFAGRSLLYILCLLVCAAYGIIASAILRVGGYGGLSQWTVARAFKWTMWAMAGVEFVVQGEENLTTRPSVIIGNHQSELDILMLGSTMPPYCSVTAKKSLKYWPLLGWFMSLSKTVFIDRGNRDQARSAFDGAAETMKSDRQSVFIFPEGTRSYTAKPEMLPFKKGAFHLAVRAQVPIIPAVVANYSNVLHVQSKRFTTGKIQIKVLPPVSTTNLTTADVDGLTQKVRDMMLAELVKLTEAARAQDIAVSKGAATGLDNGKAGPGATTTRRGVRSAA